MQVNDVIEELSSLFDDFKPSWSKRFYEQLNPVAGNRLREGFDKTMAAWKLKRFPRPGEIMANVPAKAYDPDEPVPESPFEWVKTVFKSPVGRKWLDAGCGYALEIWCLYHPNKYPPDTMLAEEIAAHERLLERDQNYRVANSNWTIGGFLSEMRVKNEMLRNWAERL